MARPFTWSYSKLKNYETCPKRHYHVDLAKDAKEEDSEALLWGNRVHKALEDRLARKVPLPQGMESYEKWCALIELDGEAQILVEQKLALNDKLEATEFFADDAWFRAKGDVIKTKGPVALVLDWKTGRVIEDSVQLALAAQCVFSRYPEVMAVRSEFIFLKEGVNVPEIYKREDMPRLWQGLWPRIERMKKAAETMSYPPDPGPLCRKWCPVKQCPHHGVG